MTNLENIKKTLCETINAMDEETLFEFVSEYDEGGYFPMAALFPCKKCRTLFGDCEAYKSQQETDYVTCQNRFKKYCSSIADQ